MIRLEDDWGIRPCNWYTRRVGRFVVLYYETYLITPLAHTPISHQTIIGRVAA